MAKIMLVEDDNNLREIYEARLQAEGYTIVAAKDGEEALVLAKNEKPDLVISDVMMPKISGFEMLDILRNTDGLKEVKVIMLTALGQSDDQQRADRLGADRYLVKSQVTLEDIVKVAHQLLDDEAAEVPAAVAASQLSESAAETPAATPATPSVPAVAPAAAVDTPTEPVASAAPVIAEPNDSTTTTTPPPSDDTAAPADNTAPSVPVVTDTASTDSVAQSTAQEEATVETEIANFVTGASSEPTTPDAADAGATVVEPSLVPAPLDTTPPDITPSEASATAASDDKVMADAVDKLVANTTESENDTPKVPETPAPLSVEPLMQQPQPAPTVTPTEPRPSADDAAPAASSTGSVPIAHKKIISPIDNTEPKQDIGTLLALEEAKEAVAAAPATPVVTSGDGASAPQSISVVAPETAAPVVPASTPSSTAGPVPAPEQPTSFTPNDPQNPNSIAL